MVLRISKMEAGVKGVGREESFYRSQHEQMTTNDRHKK